MRASAFDSSFDDFAVRFGGERASAALTTGSGCAADSVQIDFVGLGGFVVDYGVDTLDVETAGGEVGGEEEGGFSVAEELDACDTLWRVSTLRSELQYGDLLVLGSCYRAARSL